MKEDEVEETEEVDGEFVEGNDNNDETETDTDTAEDTTETQE